MGPEKQAEEWEPSEEQFGELPPPGGNCGRNARVCIYTTHFRYYLIDVRNMNKTQTKAQKQLHII